MRAADKYIFKNVILAKHFKYLDMTISKKKHRSLFNYNVAPYVQIMGEKVHFLTVSLT